MKRIQTFLLIFMATVMVSAAIGFILGAFNYTFWHLSDFNLSQLARFAISLASGFSQFFGAIVFFCCLVQLLLFSEPLSESEEVAANALGVGVAWTVLFIPSAGKPIFYFSVLLLIGGLVWVGVAMWNRHRNTPKPEPVGIIVETKRNGLAALEWSQLVATDDTLASENARGRFQFYLGFVTVCTAFAFVATGDFEHTFIILILSGWFGLFALRGAGSLKMQGQTLGSVPHVKTEAERREEVIPVTKREDCQAYLEVADNQVWFCIDRGDKTKGPLTLAERVPWESFSNFEEGSHKQWFRGRGSVSDLADWGVIVAQSSVGRVVKVAESVHEQAWLVELLVTLQNTFIAPRDVMIRQMREAQQLRERAQRKSSDPGSSDPGAVPKRSF